MSETNGNGKHRNGQLYAALLAIIEMGKEEKLPADGIGFRLALNRNHLRPVGEAIEEAQQALRAEYQIEETGALKTPEERAAWASRARACEAAAKTLMAQEVAWTSPAVIRWQQFADRSLKPEWLAPLIEVGIVACDPAELNATEPTAP